MKRPGISNAIAVRAADQVEHLAKRLAQFNKFYDGYDPLYTFWAHEAHKRAQTALQAYADALRKHVVGFEAISRE